MNRPEAELKKLRPSLRVNVMEAISPVEQFQNDVVRPILKQQHELLYTIWNTDHYFNQSTESIDTRAEYQLSVTHWLQHNINVRGSLLGCIVGLMTLEEVEFYKDNQRELNKRIVSMLAQRITDSKFGSNKFS